MSDSPLTHIEAYRGGLPPPFGRHFPVCLICREPNPDDARSTMICLLPAGRAAIEKAASGHVEDVRRNFIDLLTPAELDMLATLNERVLRHLAIDDNYPAEDKPS